MLACKGLRSPHHSARIVSIDTSQRRGAPRRVRRRRPTRTCRRTSSATSRRSASRADEPYLAERRGALQGPADRRRGGDRRGHRDRGARPDRREVRGARAVPRHPQGLRSRPAADDRQGQRLLLRPLRPPQGDQGRRGRGLREGRRDRQGLLPPERDRAGADRAAGLPRRARERRPADRLHLHAGDVLHDGRARRAPAARARQHQARRRHGRRRLRRQGRLRHRAARRDPRAQGPPPGALDLHARGGDALRQRARLLARRDGRRAHEGRLDPRPQGADAARRRRLHALLELRRDEALVPPGRRLHGAGAAHAGLRRLVEPRADDRHARLRRDLGVVRDRAADDPQRERARHRSVGVPAQERQPPRRSHADAQAARGSLDDRHDPGLRRGRRAPALGDLPGHEERGALGRVAARRTCVDQEADAKLGDPQEAAR